MRCIAILDTNGCLEVYTYDISVINIELKLIEYANNIT